MRRSSQLVEDYVGERASVRRLPQPLGQGLQEQSFSGYGDACQAASWKELRVSHPTKAADWIHPP